MAGPIGLIYPAAALGLGALLFRPPRGFFKQGTKELLIPLAQATVSETHNDRMVITEHPVEQNAAISDHAYKMPAEVTIRCAWSNSPSGPSGIISQAVGIGSAVFGAGIGAIQSIPQTIDAAQSLFAGADVTQAQYIYGLLLALQEKRAPFDILTGKRSYTNMLFEQLHVDTDRLTENCLMLTAVCKQVIIVSTSTITVPINTTANSQPKKFSPPIDLGVKNMLTGQNFKPFESIFGDLLQ